MNDEEIDWNIYHMIPGSEEGISIPDLAEKAGIPMDSVVDSLIRLEDKHLVIVKGDRAYPLSITDFLFASQIKEVTNGLDDMGIYIEDGVIKVRK